MVIICYFFLDLYEDDTRHNIQITDGRRHSNVFVAKQQITDGRGHLKRNLCKDITKRMIQNVRECGYCKETLGPKHIIKASVIKSADGCSSNSI